MLVRILPIFVILFTASPALAQMVQVQLQQPPPNQLLVTDLWRITLVNLGQEPVPVRIRGTVTEQNDGVILEAESSVFTLSAAVMSLSARDLEPISINSSDSRYEQVVLRTGGAPAGMYTYCAEVVHADFMEILGVDCMEVMVDPGTPPVVILPADGDVLNTPFPVFAWLEPVPPPLWYEISLYPVFDGQSPAEAIATNAPYFFQDGITVTNLNYPIDAQLLEHGNYVLQVGAVSGGAVLSRSEPVMFAIEGFPDGETGISWISPVDGEELDGEEIRFEWDDPEFPDWLPPTGPFYAFTMTMLEAGQNPDNAINLNEPLVQISEIRDRFITLQTNEALTGEGSYAARVDRYDVNGVLMAQSPAMAFTFSEATLGPCDTLEVMNVITESVGNIRDDICDIKHDLMDQLLAALDDYQDKKWKADALKGEIENANEYKQNLTNMQDFAVGNLQAELDRLNDQKNECNLAWQQEFYNRYVANANVGGSMAAKQRRYDRAVQNVSNRFNRQMDAMIRDAESRLDGVRDHYDSLMSSLDSYISDKEAEHDDAQRDADDAMTEATRLFNAIKDNLCGLEGDWNELFAYMEANFHCIDCDEIQVPVPLQFREMEDCLRDLFSKLNGWRSGIRQPESEEVLKAQANQHFNDSAAMDMFNDYMDMLSGMQDAIDDFNAQSQSVQMNDRACGILQTYASGGRSFGRYRSPSSHSGSSYGGTSTAQTFTYPTTGNYAPSSQERSAARRDRNDFLRSTRDLSRDINLTTGRMNRGFNGRGIENGFADATALDLHGKAAAVKHHQASADALNDLVNDMLRELRDCYNMDKHQQQRIRFNNLRNECVDFRAGLQELDERYADHAGKTAEAEQELSGQLEELEREIERLKRDQNGNSSVISDLSRLIDRLKERLGDLRREASNEGSQAEKDRAIAEMERRIADLERMLAEANRDQRALEDLIAELERLRDRIRNGLGGYGDITQPRPVGSSGEVQDASNEIDRERQEKERRAREIQAQLDEAARKAREAADKARGAGSSADAGLAGGSYAETVLGEYLNWIRWMREQYRLRELRKKKVACLTIIEQYRALYEREPGILESFWNWLTGVFDDLAEFPEGIISDIDELNEFISEMRDQIDEIKEILDLFKAMNTDDPMERARAFGKIIELTDNIGGKTVFVGDMLRFYAAAYNAAIARIAEIAEDLRRPAKAVIDSYNISCTNLDYENKTLEELIDDAWRNFMSNDLNSAPIRGLSPEQQRTMERYFRDSAARRIMECCIDILLSN